MMKCNVLLRAFSRFKLLERGGKCEKDGKRGDSPYLSWSYVCAQYNNDTKQRQYANPKCSFHTERVQT